MCAYVTDVAINFTFYFYFLAIIVICLNTFYMHMSYTEYHMFNLNLIYLHVTLMVCFKTNFLLRTINIILSEILTRASVMHSVSDSVKHHLFLFQLIFVHVIIIIVIIIFSSSSRGLLLL